jgi:hypothetical protein
LRQNCRSALAAPARDRPICSRGDNVTFARAGAPENQLLRVHVSGFAGGNAFGLLTVEPGALAFKPGLVTRHALQLSGILVHRGARVIVVSSPLALGGLHVVLRASTAGDALVMSPLLSRRPRNVAYGCLFLPPWRRTRTLIALRLAGFNVEKRRRFVYFGIRPID